jgi:hypothetical protein
MREKVREYAVDGDKWPLAANILDPIRWLEAILILEHSLPEIPKIVSLQIAICLGSIMMTPVSFECPLCPRLPRHIRQSSES